MADQTDILLMMAIGLSAALCAGLAVWSIFSGKRGRGSSAGTARGDAGQGGEANTAFRTYRAGLSGNRPWRDKFLDTLELIGGVVRLGSVGEELAQDYAACGWPGGLSDRQLVALPLVIAALVALVCFVPFLLVSPPLVLLAPVLGFAVGYLGVKSWMTGRGEDRKMAISRSMPFVMDLISMSMSAGASLVMVLEMVRVDYGAHPIGAEFARIVDRIHNGVPVAEAIADFKEGLADLPIVGTFADDVIQSLRFGRPLAQTLQESSGRYKSMRIQIAREKAGKAKVKILVPGILILFGGLLILFGPFIVKFITEQSSMGSGMWG